MAFPVLVAFCIGSRDTLIELGQRRKMECYHYYHHYHCHFHYHFHFHSHYHYHFHPY